MSLRTAIHLALENNIEFRRTGDDYLISIEGVRESRGAFAPRLDANYTRYLPRERVGDDFDRDLDEASMALEGELGYGGSYRFDVTGSRILEDSAASSDDDTVDLTAGFRYTQPLLRGFRHGENKVNLLVSKNNKERAFELLRQGAMDLIRNVEFAYYRLLFAQENLKIAERNEVTTEKLLEDNKNRVKSGASAPRDILQTEAELARRQQERSLRKLEREESMNALKRLVYRDGGLGSSIVVSENMESAESESSFQDDLEIAFENRPELALARKEVRRNELVLLREKNANRAQLDLVAEVRFQGTGGSLDSSYTDFESTDGNEYSLGFDYSIPIGGGQEKARRAAAKIRLDRAKLAYEAVERDIRLELELANRRLKLGWQRALIAQGAVEFASEALEAEKKLLRAGNSTTFLVVRLQQDLSQAEIRAVQANVDYLLELSAYERLKGVKMKIWDIDINNYINPSLN